MNGINAHQINGGVKMPKDENTGIQVIPTTREQVTRINTATNRIEFDLGRFQQNAEKNRARYVKSVEVRRQKIATRDRD